MSDPITKLLEQRDVLLIDGATGTTMFDLGLANGASGELWNVERPADVRQVYQGFVDAGSDIILTNSFGANVFRFALHKLQKRVRELNMASAALAREIADKAGRPVIVAGSMGPTGDVLQPLGPRTIAEAEEAFHVLAGSCATAAWTWHGSRPCLPTTARRRDPRRNACRRRGNDDLRYRRSHDDGHTAIEAMRRSRSLPTDRSLSRELRRGPAMLDSFSVGGRRAEAIIVPKAIAACRKWATT